jgi:hypothetical protein
MLASVPSTTLAVADGPRRSALGFVMSHKRSRRGQPSNVSGLQPMLTTCWRGSCSGCWVCSHVCSPNGDWNYTVAPSHAQL